MKRSRKIFIPEMNCFGEEFDCILTCSNIQDFLKSWDIETLQRLLETQLKHENYEMAFLIRKHIESKKAIQQAETKSKATELHNKYNEK